MHLCLIKHLSLSLSLSLSNKCQSRKTTMQICPRQSARWYDDECHKLRATYNFHRNRFRKSKDERDKTNRDDAKSNCVRRNQR